MKSHNKSPRLFKGAIFPLIVTLILCFSIGVFANDASRERQSLDKGWKFMLGNASDPSKDFDFGIDVFFSKAVYFPDGPLNRKFDDTSWRTVDLPHDWAVELGFDSEGRWDYGYRAIGRKFPQNSIGWYRYHFASPASDLGRRISIEFDGVFRDCQMWINGHYLGRNESGYSFFSYDLSDYLEYGGENTLVIRVDATQAEGWFYEGAGIYRHVWLLKTAPVHMEKFGTQVISTLEKDNARVAIKSNVINESTENTSLQMVSEVFNPQGKLIGSGSSKEIKIPGGDTFTFDIEVNVPNPTLWSPETPNLYKAVCVLKKGEDTVDRIETQFGIRTFYFDPNNGFFLNGKPYVIKGVCCHQDHAGVGSALPDTLQYFRIQRLKEMGINAYRTSHNPPTVELLEACDRLGMLVMDEQRFMGSTKEALSQLETLIKRDRNHASVFLWSIGNEESGFHTTPTGERIARTMKAVIGKLDPTRLVTYAANIGNVYKGVNSVVDVRGWNYYIGKGETLDSYHKEHPEQPNIGSEQASTLCTRGEYFNNAERCYMASYDENAPAWGATAEYWWKIFAERPWMSGGFVWTGFDYHGEPTPYKWPAVVSQFGIMDLCGFPKDDYYYYKSWWTHETVLHILPHWNWKGKEGQPVDVRVFSNCDEVELFLNGKSQGKKKMEPNSHLRWQVLYAPGVLLAKGFNKGKQVIVSRVETTGEPVSFRMVKEAVPMAPKDENISIYTITAVDKKGRVVPTANAKCEFQVSPGAEIIGVGNGDPSSHDPEKANWCRLFNGYCQVIVKNGELLPLK